MRREHSVYEVTCECGHRFETPVKTVECPQCRRLLELHWGEEDGEQ